MSEFTSEELQIIRHDITRKTCFWEEAKGYVCVSNALYEKLPKWKIPLGFNPDDNFPDEVNNTFFVADSGDRKYLVNTEGFSYARYFAILIVCDNYTKYTDYEFSLLKHYNGCKLNSWEFAQLYIEPITIPKSLYDKLPKLNVSNMKPTDELPEKLQEFFIAIHKDCNFIVNKEGTKYSKYIAPISIGE